MVVDIARVTRESTRSSFVDGLGDRDRLGDHAENKDGPGFRQARLLNVPERL